MQFQFTFRHVDPSNSIRDYAEDQFTRGGRLLLKESRCQVSFSKGRYDCQVNVIVSGGWGTFKASSSGDDFYHAVDLVAEKLSKQFQKRKEQLQHHKRPELSRRKRIKNLQEAFEHEALPRLKRSA